MSRCRCWIIAYMQLHVFAIDTYTKAQPAKLETAADTD